MGQQSPLDGHIVHLHFSEKTLKNDETDRASDPKNCLYTGGTKGALKGHNEAQGGT